MKVKGLTHAYELLYPENMPEYVVIELKNGERPKAALAIIEEVFA